MTLPTVPFLISAGLIIVGAAASWYVATLDSLALSDGEIVHAVIAISASVGALVSGTFVIASYLQTNRAFRESQRPQLLVQVMGGIPRTRIHYENITANMFVQLNLQVVVQWAEGTVELSELFEKDMVMVGRDSRDRYFDTKDELRKRGLDPEKVMRPQSDLRLLLGYSYCFLGSLERVDLQKYKWDHESNAWSIV